MNGALFHLADSVWKEIQTYNESDTEYISPVEWCVWIQRTFVVRVMYQVNFLSQNVCPIGARTLQEGKHPHLDGFLQVKLGPEG